VKVSQDVTHVLRLALDQVHRQSARSSRSRKQDAGRSLNVTDRRPCLGSSVLQVGRLVGRNSRPALSQRTEPVGDGASVTAFHDSTGKWCESRMVLHYQILELVLSQSKDVAEKNEWLWSHAQRIETARTQTRERIWWHVNDDGDSLDLLGFVW
jgi:hypothetical protein